MDLMGTPPKTNMEPENDGFQKESPLPGVHFQVPCQFSGVYPVSYQKFRGGNISINDEYERRPFMFGYTFY